MTVNGRDCGDAKSEFVTGGFRFLLDLLRYKLS